MRNRIKLLNALWLIFLSHAAYSQNVGTTWPARFVCENTTSTDFTIGERNIPYYAPEGGCQGTIVQAFGTLTMIESLNVSLVDLQNGFYDTRIQIGWKSGAVGTATVQINYGYNQLVFIHGQNVCATAILPTEGNTFTFHRGIVEQPGELTAPADITEFVRLDPTADPVSLSLLYTLPRSSSQPDGLDLQRVRWFNGTFLDDTELENSFFDKVTRLDFTKTSFGTEVITTEVMDQCDTWHPGGSLTINVLPTCYHDNPSQATISLVEPPVDTYSDGAIKINPNQNYTLASAGLTDFASHYTWSADGGSDLQFSGNSFSVSAPIGSYTISATPKLGRESCPVPAPLRLLVLGNADGSKLIVTKNCPIVFPADIPDITGISDPNNLVLQHFVVTAKSNQAITVMPGITLELGAELVLDMTEPDIGSDAQKNFTEQTLYDEYGRMLGNSRSYFDERGVLVQTQSKSLSKAVILASAPLYDAYGRAAITTLSAPVSAYQGPEGGKDSNDCPIIPNKNISFAYKPDFVKASASTRYTSVNFDLKLEPNGTITSKELTPDPVYAGTEGTLGWYYSSNNGTSTNPRMNEPLVATTQYPYSRTLFHRDGSGEAKAATKPGDIFKAGSGNVGFSQNEPVASSDAYVAAYLSIRQTELGLQAGPVAGEYVRSVAVDAMEKKSVSYADKSGNTIISLYFGPPTTQGGTVYPATPITKSYQFYDNAGRLKVSVSPNGVQQYERPSPNNVAFADIDKTEYFYNSKGQIAAVEETDAGRTEYVYRKDGKIRFSQNEKQRTLTAGDASDVISYSYTNYDRSGRPIESGEFIPGPGGIAFKSAEMTGILENVTVDGGIAETSGQKRSRLKTFYDEPDAQIPGGRTQRFVQGAVSRTQKNSDITTWYSYDERGRVEFVVQNITDLGVKTIDYRYGPIGQVQEVLYQKGNTQEQFSHYYEYDADGRLFKAYTSRSELQYDKKGKLTNPEVRELQATYHYYLHGPLKRVELAGNLQGIDYVYTADGALKAINSADPNASTDPGQDGVGTSPAFRKDVFGMTLDYYNGDYNSSGNTLPGVVIPGGYAEQHGGLIRTMRWHSPIKAGKEFGYAYTYDSRNQLSNATWGSVTASAFVANPLNAYNESVTSYDLNGNIGGLIRKNAVGSSIANFDYDYIANTNKLELIKPVGGGDALRDYQYTEIGELKHEKIGDDEKFIEYDVTGKVTTVYSDAAKQEKITSFVYDDRGFRLSKTTYNQSGTPTARTWYVRDASGSVMGTYEDDLTEQQAPAITELPVYASGRIGVYKPQFEPQLKYTQYELTDHLGNVRALIGRDLVVEYLATMESERTGKERSDQGGEFDNVHNDPTATDFNHTPSSVTVNGTAETISNPNEVIRMNNMPVSGEPTSPVGTGIMLWVHPGDVIDAEVFAKYVSFNPNNQAAITNIANQLIAAFGVSPSPIDGSSIFDVVETPDFLNSNVWDNLDDQQPRAFLNYLLFDNNNVLQENGFDFDQVSEDAKIIGSVTDHEKLSLQINVEKEGYIYIYVSNQSNQSTEVFFDDLKVTHKYSDIVGGADFYPFGLTIEDRQIQREFYRHGYQGQFAEKDEETGWNHFELREYDPVIGRWTRPDPARQYSSPFLGMGNNPIRRVDPDGAYDDPKNWFQRSWNWLTRRGNLNRSYSVGVQGPVFGEEAQMLEWQLENNLFRGDYRSVSSREFVRNSSTRLRTVVLEEYATFYVGEAFSIGYAAYAFKLRGLSRTTRAVDKLSSWKSIGDFGIPEWHIYESGEQSIFVARHAMKHLEELAMHGAGNPRYLRLLGQTHQKALHSAIDDVLSRGPIKFNEMYRSGGNEIMFGAPRAAGELPAVIHFR